MKTPYGKVIHVTMAGEVFFDKMCDCDGPKCSGGNAWTYDYELAEEMKLRLELKKETNQKKRKIILSKIASL